MTKSKARCGRKKQPGVILAQSTAPLEELEAALGIRLRTGEEDEEIDTLGGLVFLRTGRVPARGEVVDHESGAEIEIVDADPRRIKRLRIRLPAAWPPLPQRLQPAEGRGRKALNGLRAVHRAGPAGARRPLRPPWCGDRAGAGALQPCLAGAFRRLAALLCLLSRERRALHGLLAGAVGRGRAFRCWR